MECSLTLIVNKEYENYYTNTKNSVVSAWLDSIWGIIMVDLGKLNDYGDYDAPYTAEEFKRVMDERHPGILQREYPESDMTPFAVTLGDGIESSRRSSDIYNNPYSDPRWFRYLAGTAPLLSGVIGLSAYLGGFSDGSLGRFSWVIYGGLTLFGVYCLYYVWKHK